MKTETQNKPADEMQKAFQATLDSIAKTRKGIADLRTAFRSGINSIEKVQKGAAEMQEACNRLLERSKRRREERRAEHWIATIIVLMLVISVSTPIFSSTVDLILWLALFATGAGIVVKKFILRR